MTSEYIILDDFKSFTLGRGSYGMENKLFYLFILFNTRGAVVYLYVFAVRYVLSCDMNCHVGEVVSRILQSYKQINRH